MLTVDGIVLQDTVIEESSPKEDAGHSGPGKDQNTHGREHLKQVG